MDSIIYFVSTDSLTEADETELKALLPADRAFSRESIAARKALLCCTERLFGKSALDYEYTRTPYGKWQCSEFFFSLTHKHGLAAAAVSERQIGIDLEYIPDFVGRYSDAEKRRSLMRHICAPGESPESEYQLLELWTRKEAAFKAFFDGNYYPVSILAQDYEVSTIYPPMLPGYLMSVAGATIELRDLFIM